MKESKKGVIERITVIINYLSQKKIGMYAAGAGYFIVLSLFPLLVLLLALLRYTGLQVETLTDLVEGFLPDALLPSTKRLIVSTYRNTSGAVVSLSAVAGLWSASRGVYGLLMGLNAVYGVSENRGYIYTRTVSVLYTFVFLLLLLATLVLNVFGTTILQNLPFDNNLLLFLWDIVDWRFLVMLLLQTGLFCAMFMALPNGQHTFRQSLPGALLASVGWLVFSDLYSVYVENFSGYSNVYGSVYGVALSMLWLYFCISIVFYGGALNAYLAQQKQKE